MSWEFFTFLKIYFGLPNSPFSPARPQGLTLRYLTTYCYSDHSTIVASVLDGAMTSTMDLFSTESQQILMDPIDI